MKAGIIIDKQEEARIEVLKQIFTRLTSLELVVEILKDGHPYFSIPDDFPNHERAKVAIEPLKKAAVGYVTLCVPVFWPMGAARPLDNDEYIVWLENRVMDLLEDERDPFLALHREEEEWRTPPGGVPDDDDPF